MLRRWLNSILALCIAASPAFAEGFGAGGGFNIEGKDARSLNETVTLTRGTCETSTTNATTYNFTTIDTGSSETDTGLVVIVAMGEDNAITFGVNSVTVNGIPYTEVIDEDGAGVVDAALYRSPVEVQGGSLATVDVTFSEALAGSATVCAWMLKNLQSLTPTSSVQDDDTASGALVLTTGTTTSGGFVIGGCIVQDTGVTTAWGVLTEREDTDNGEHDYSNADAAATGASMANTCDWSGTGDASGVAAAFR